MCDSNGDRPALENNDGGDPRDLLAGLARSLFEELERLDPSLEPSPGWEELSDRDREMYGLCVRRLLDAPELLPLLADHHQISRHVHEGEEMDGGENVMNAAR